MSSSFLSDNLRKSLDALARQDRQRGIKIRFEQDPLRVDKCTFEIEGLYIDFSKTHLSDQLLELYSAFAEQINFTGKRQNLFAGEAVNFTEQRPALHTLLRDPDNQGIAMSSSGLLQQASQARKQLVEQYTDIQSRLADMETTITDIIHVGIGGSALGTQVLFEALKGFQEKRRIHFIGNIDAHKLVSVLANCRAESTLVIGVSKTFTTTETLQNLQTLDEWFKQQGSAEPMDNFIGVTAMPANAAKFGIHENNVVTFPEWVGGRYSVWSSVSLSAILLLGIERFDEFLSGAAAIDSHFYQTDTTHNICFIAAALDHYYSNFMGAGSRAIFAYDDRLRSLVNYLQQLETESNGKDRQIDGSPADQKTSAVIWGGIGTDVQHSVFQLLHQGTALIPAEFIMVCGPGHKHSAHQTELLANGIAQTAALLAGQELDSVRELHSDDNLSELTLQSKIFAGDRPSTTFLLDQLSPRNLGALLAFYEHRTFCGGVLANINSFDQMGVELGKRLAQEVKPLLQGSGDGDKSSALDPSTLRLIDKVKGQRR